MLLQQRLFLVTFLLFFTISCAAYNHEKVAALLQEQAYAEVLAITANTPEAERDNYLLNTAGYAAYQNSMPDKAFAFFTRSQQLDTQNIQALLYLGIIRKQQHVCTEALPYFLQLIALKPANGRYYKYAADCYTELKQPDSSFALLATAYQVVKTDPAIAAAYADQLLEKKQFAATDSVLANLLTIYPDNSLLLTAAIKSAYLQKKYRDVFPLAETLIQSRNLAYAPIFYTLLAALQLKEYPVCLSYAEILQTAGFENEQVLYYTAKAYAGLKKYDESNRLLEQCIRKGISEHIEDYYTDLAENRVAQKSYTSAQQYYDTARYLTGNPLLSYRKAIAYDAAQQDAPARKAFGEFIKAPGKSDTALIRYAKKRLAANEQ